MILKTELLPHQRRAVEKLENIRVGALFMDMGTGKSRTAIELVYRRRRRISNVVWFCPVSTKHKIAQEIGKHIIDPDVHVFDDKTSMRNLPAAQWHVVGLESMSASKRVIFAVNKLINERSFIIVDESEKIKGYTAARTNWITRLSEKTRYRYILSGTPVSQGIQDLYSQMRFLSPDILGYRSFYEFQNNHIVYSDKFKGMIVGNRNLEWLAAKIQPYTYQVTKEECLKSLPPKKRSVSWCDISSDQYRAYARAKAETLDELSCGDTFLPMMRLFGALQQIACGFWRRRNTTTKEFMTKELEHGRLELLDEEIQSIPETEKIVIWAKFLYDVRGIVGMLQERYGADAVAQFHGEISQRNRVSELDRFKSNARFLVGTQSTGGHGLDITEAAYEIFYSNTFRFADRAQAEDRCHRIGQTRTVHCIDVCCDCGIEQRIQAALETKSDVLRSFRDQVNRIKDDPVKIKELIKSL